jgi:prepilin peptidase CpaA
LCLSFFCDFFFSPKSFSVIHMILLMLYLFFFILVIVVGGLASWSDFKGLEIPNWHTGAVLGLFVLSYSVMWMFGRDDVFASLSSHVLSAVIVFGVTLAMFAAGGLGAADSKLGSAYALWVGVPGLMPFLFYMAIFGGVLAVAALALKKWKQIKSPPKGSWVERVQSGESKVPYGMAIVFGALASFLKIGYFSPEVLSSFVLI